MIVFIASVFTIILIYFTYTDIRFKILPNKLMYPALGGISTYRFFYHDAELWTYFATGGIAGGLFLILALINRNWIGGGDVKLLAFVGIALGWELMVVAMIIISIIGFIFSILAAWIKRSVRQVIPFGPFIASGGILAVWFGNSFLEKVYELLNTTFMVI